MSFGTSFALTTRPTIMGRNAAVVAGHQLAARAGMRMLETGGNAVDAAIAVAAAAAVLKPDACALGSDLFMLFAKAGTNEVFALNASGPAPRLATREAFPNGIEHLGLRAASVPGAVDGWYRAITRFGRLTLSDVLAPAIELAHGAPVSALFASTIAKNEDALRRFPETYRIYCPGGRPPRAGEVLVQADLARTLEAIANEGPQSFYRGAFARALDGYAQASGAFLRADDLAGYEAEWREPLRSTYRGYELIGQPPVSVGLAVLEAMQILEHFPMADLEDSSAERIHLQVEAMKIAMSDVRGHLGDPVFVPERAVPELLDRGRSELRAKEIDPAHARDFEPANLFAKAGTDTSYAAVVDADGNAVSLLQSVYHVFGCGEVIPGTGALLNNRMTGFSLDPASPNALEPGKRTMHTLNPLLVRREGRAAICLGTPGGPSQVYTNVELLTRLIDDRLEPQRAVDAPRWFVTPSGDLNVERSVSADVRAALAARGHRVVDFPAHSASFGGAGVILLNAANVREAAADPRRETYALAC